MTLVYRNKVGIMSIMDLTHLPATAQAFLEQLLSQRRLSPLTQRRYAHALGVLHTLAPDLKAISHAQMQRAISQHHGAGLLPRSLAVMVAAWRTYCAWAHQQGILATDHSRDLLMPKVIKPLPKAMGVDKTRVYLDASPTPLVAGSKDQAMQLRDQAVLEVIYGCGLRASEVLGLDCQKTAHSVSWFNAAAQSVRVLGKGNKPRTVPLPNMALAALNAWLAVRPTCLNDASAKNALIDKAQTENALFLGARGARLSGTELRRITQRRAAHAQSGQGVHPHMLRHGYASHLLQNGGDLRGIQELLGHASVRATQVYTRLDFQHLAKAYDDAHPRSGHKKTAAQAALTAGGNAERDSTGVTEKAQTLQS
jgi:integrase/recombinase XerC